MMWWMVQCRSLVNVNGTMQKLVHVDGVMIMWAVSGEQHLLYDECPGVCARNGRKSVSFLTIQQIGYIRVTF